MLLYKGIKVAVLLQIFCFLVKVLNCFRGFAAKAKINEGGKQAMALPTKQYVIDKSHSQIFGPHSGVKSLGIVAGNPKFQYVDLPYDWKELPGPVEGSYHYIVDCKGRKRAYSRGGTVGGEYVKVLWPLSRFQVGYLQVEGLLVGCARDGGKLIYTTEPIKPVIDGRDALNYRDFLDQRRSENRAKEWLDKNYPDWREPGAYWED